MGLPLAMHRFYSMAYISLSNYSEVTSVENCCQQQAETDGVNTIKEVAA